MGPFQVLSLLTGLSLVMRFFSFFPSVMDHDESTYIVIADAVRQGQVYLRDVIDTKPIGIFLLFGAFQSLLGKSIIAIRVITALWVALTGWMLYLTHRELLKGTSTRVSDAGPLATGIIYVFTLSVFTNFGVSPNTELFFALFSATALFLVLRYTSPVLFMIAGFLLGLGFMIKYVVLFDALAIGFFYLWMQVVQGKKWGYWFLRCTLMAIAFLIPILCVWMYYRQLGMEEQFLFYTFEVSHQYFVKPPLTSYILFFLEGIGRIFPVTILFIYCTVHWRTTGLRLPLLAWGWTALVIFIIMLPGKTFPHYFIQLLLPFSLFAGSFFDPRRIPGPAFAWIRNPKIGYPLLGLGLLVNVVFQKTDYIDKADYPREIAAYLNERLAPDDIIYTANAPQIIYHLTSRNSPTPYVHPSLIWSDDNSQALGISQTEEWHKILAQSPRFIITKNNQSPSNLMKPAMDTSYQQVMSFGPKLLVFERK